MEKYSPQLQNKRLHPDSHYSCSLPVKAHYNQALLILTNPSIRDRRYSLKWVTFTWILLTDNQIIGK